MVVHPTVKARWSVSHPGDQWLSLLAGNCSGMARMREKDIRPPLERPRHLGGFRASHSGQMAWRISLRVRWVVEHLTDAGKGGESSNHGSGKVPTSGADCAKMGQFRLFLVCCRVCCTKFAKSPWYFRCEKFSRNTSAKLLGTYAAGTPDCACKGARRPVASFQ